MAGFLEQILILQHIENEEQRHQFKLHRRMLRDTSDPFSMPECIFKGVYRLSRELARHVIDEISPHLYQPQRPQISLTNAQKVLATLHILGHGSYQKSVAQDCMVPMSQPSVSRVINSVCSAIITHFADLIEFPTTEFRRSQIKEDFLGLGGFPGIIGAIDCTQIAIQAPPFNNDEMPGIVFLNRKGFYSINTQIIVDAKLKILAICARFPGSVHDSAIWGQSVVKRHLEELYLNQGRNFNSWLIGDSGYPLQPFLMTPVGGNNLTPQEALYNRKHKSARNVIERLNGVLKSTFRCCLKHRTLHYKPTTAAKIIHSCAILHNLRLIREEAHYEDVINEDDDIEPVEHEEVVGRNWLNEGRQRRDRIINALN